MEAHLRKATNSLTVYHAQVTPPQASTHLLIDNTHLEGTYQWGTSIDLHYQHHSSSLGRLKGLCSQTSFLQ